MTLSFHSFIFLSRTYMTMTSDAAGTKRPLPEDNTEDNTAPPAPADFVALPFYGEHKKAVSACSFAPTHAQSPFAPGHDGSVAAGGGTSCADADADTSAAGPAAPAVCASASADGTVKLWKLTSEMLERGAVGTEAEQQAKPGPLGALRTLHGHARGINDVAWSPTAEYLATASDDKSLRIWDAETGGALVELRGHTNYVFSCAFSPQTNLLVSGSFDETVKLWDVRSGDCVSTLPAHSDPKLWKLTSEMLERGAVGTEAEQQAKPGPLGALRTLHGHARGINDVAWSPTAEYLATASDDKSLRIWDAETGGALVELRGHTNYVFSCAFSPQTNLLVSGSFDETVKLWDVRSGDCVSTLPAHSDPVTGVDFNRDGTCVVSGSHDGLIRIWDTMTGECLKTIYAGGNPPVSYVRFSPNGKFVLTGTLDSTLRLWRAGDRDGAVDDAAAAPVTGVDFNRDGTCVVSGSHDGLIRIWDTMTGECLKTIYAGGNPPVSYVRFSPNGKFVLTGTLDSTLRLWRAGDRDGAVDDAAAAPAGGGSALGGGGARCTKTYAGGHRNSKFCIFSAFAVADPRRQSIVTGSEDGGVYVYDLQRRDVRQVLRAHKDAVLAVAAHDNRELLASGGMTEDKTVRFWVPGARSSYR